MTATPSKGVRAARAELAQQVFSMRAGSGLPFEIIARQLKLSHRSNAKRFYISAVLADVKRYWFKLPMDLRNRWWDETNYGESKPGMPLVNALATALQSIKSK